jgi:hypothetical protein
MAMVITRLVIQITSKLGRSSVFCFMMVRSLGVYAASLLVL